MTSISGTPYSDLENAFRYRKEYDAACSCGMIPAVPQPDGTEGELTTAVIALGARFAVGAGVALPRARPDPSEDPDTLVNRATGFTPGSAIPREPSLAAVPGLKRNVRIVGPEFFYGQSAEAAVPFPDRDRAQ